MRGGQVSVLELLKNRLLKILIPPQRPKSGWGAGGRVPAVEPIDRKQQLGIGEQMRNLVHALIAQMLGDALCNHVLARVVRVRAFGFDDHQRNAIHKTDNIRSASAGSAGVEDFKFVGHMELITVRIIPANKRDRGLGALAVNEFGDCDAERQAIVYALVGS